MRSPPPCCQSRRCQSVATMCSVRPSVGSAEHAGEAPAVDVDGVDGLSALGDAAAVLVGHVGVLDRAIGVEADAVGCGTLAEIGPGTSLGQ